MEEPLGSFFCENEFYSEGYVLLHGGHLVYSKSSRQGTNERLLHGCIIAINIIMPTC